MRRVPRRRFSAGTRDRNFRSPDGTLQASFNCTPIVKNIWPIGTSVDSGAYAVQPVANEPPGAKNDAVIIRPPTGSIQYDSAFSRGNAMSGAPIISGST